MFVGKSEMLEAGDENQLTIIHSFSRTHTLVIFLKQQNLPVHATWNQLTVQGMFVDAGEVVETKTRTAMWKKGDILLQIHRKQAYT